ncbi:two-component sensor histidine kinase [Actinoplanes italicus]|uniref:histidine kinase n=1 Tax=Actinoplanes italicus TaxID=113567 RepID=A0A2T0KH49_9ACTN|nr:sensor histidine kinase [Actinoplanes italicus]PRX22748.1 histidine kinase/DNA gyrase B/HSP90-like ATPase [Actinoplanes italicus]GIE28270.1 two-component sensor histidine kinase [Actinoplanes italicus]
MTRIRGPAADTVAAVAVLAVCAVAAQETGPTAWWQWLLVCAVAAGVAVRRRWALPAALVTFAASGAVLASGVIAPHAAPGLYAAVALTQYAVAAALPPSRSVPELVAATGAAAALGPRWPTAAAMAALTVAVSWAAGRLVRHRRHLAEHLFQERTARAVTEERLRIARDMHDTVAHSLSMIAMKASVARHVAGVRPEESGHALEVIETASREALLEMRRTIGLLRADDDHDLRTLTDGAEQAGLRVRASIHGEEKLPAGVRLSVYRIVQESLTNVIRHAQATCCTVEVTASADAVTVQIADDGTATPAHGMTGYGLRGMRERVTGHGGDLHAGPRDGGGFVVTATIPYRP